MLSRFEAVNRSLLAPGECLVYVENIQPFADVNGTTQIAKILRSYVENDILWYDLKLITNTEGDRIKSQNVITVSADHIVSSRIFQDIEPKHLYHFVTDQTEYPITARSFTIKKNINRPLETTSRSALGSGIYGRYIKDLSELNILSSNQSVYRIDCPNGYVLQDREHGESLTVASLQTNRYVDKILQALRPHPDATLETALELIKANRHSNLSTLWNIALYRTNDNITQDWLEDVLAKYVIRYLSDNSLTDTLTGDSIQELPINIIMKELGYHGILATDSFNNGWDRGSISYNYNQATVLIGETARY
jgi:hypothetical protein